MLLIVFPLLLYLLGALAERALADPWPDEWAPATLFRRLALGLLLAGWAGVTLAELGSFSALGLCAVIVAVCVGLATYTLRRLGRTGWLAMLTRLGPWGSRRELAALGALLVLACALFGQPGEDVLGARDPGIYFATGSAIARDGGIIQQDWALRALGADLGDASVNYWLFQSVHGWPLRFPGQLFVRDLGQGTVEPGFLPWYPIAMAFAIDAAGLPAGLWVNPMLSVLALLAVYLTGRAIFGPLVAWLGTALLAVDLAEVWFARYTMAEPATQLLVWIGAYALVALARRPTAAAGALAGLAWAGTLLARVDSVLLVPPVAAYLAWEARRPDARRPALLALGLVGLGALHFGLHAWRFAPGYVSMTFSGATLAVAVGGVAATLSAAAVAWMLLPTQAGRGRQTRAALLIVLLALTALLAYTLRPALGPAGALDERGALDVAARESLVRLGWYVTPLELALALPGVARLLWTGRWQRAAPLLGLLGLSLAFYLPNPLVSADQPWAARRYLPVILPALALLAAHGAGSLGVCVAQQAARWRRSWASGLLENRKPGGAHANGAARATATPAACLVPSILAALLCLAVAFGEWRATAPIAVYREHAGTLAQIGALAALFPADAIVLFPRSPAGMRLSLPLHYLGQRASFVLPAEEPVEGVMSVVRRWRAEGRPVYWAVPQGTRFPTPPGVRFALAGQFTFTTPQLERPLDRLPAAVEPLRYDLQLYRVELAPSVAPP
ncbi:MAG TPA: glycosyltransferase family 39 protein [Chloroflexota bacterium]